MKKMQKNLLASAVALSALASLALTPVAHAEVSASVGASNMYYWRGLDLGGGAAISADINYSASGFFAGLWTSSGDEAWGTEYDIYAGYGAEFGDFNFSASVVSYNYADIGVAPGDLMEAVVSLGYGPFTATYYDNIANTSYWTNELYVDEDGLSGFLPVENAVGSDDYNYFTLALDFEKFGIKYGQHEDDLSHLDLTYKYNENLSFTVGKVIDDVDGTVNDEAKLIVNLSLQIL